MCVCVSVCALCAVCTTTYSYTHSYIFHWQNDLGWTEKCSNAPEIRPNNGENTRNTSLANGYDKQQTVWTLDRPFIFHSVCVRFSFGSHKYYFRVMWKSGKAPADTNTLAVVFWCDSAESTRLCTIKKNRFPFKQISCAEGEEKKKKKEKTRK